MQIKLTKRKIGFIFLLFLSFIYVIWNFTPLNEILKNKIIQDIYRASNETLLLSANKMSLGPGYVSIEDVSLQNKSDKTRVNIQVERLKINFRIWPLFLFQTSLTDIISHVTLVNPSFEINVNGKKRSRESDQKEVIQKISALNRFFQLNKEFPEIVIEKGELNLNIHGRKVIIVDELSGNLSKTTNDNIAIILKNMEDGRDAFAANLLYDPDTLKISNKLFFNSFRIPKLTFLEEINNVRFESGELNGELEIIANLDSLNDIDLSGRLNLSSVSGTIFDKFFTQDSLILDFDGRQFTSTCSPLQVGSNEVELTLVGDFNNKNYLHGYFSSPDFSLKSLNYYLSTDDTLVDGLLNVTGSFSLGQSFSMATSFNSSRIFLYNLWLKQVSGMVNINDNHLLLDVVSQDNNQQLKINSAYNFTDSKVTGNMFHYLTLNKANLIMFRGLDSSNIASSFSFAGDLKQREYSGNMKVELLKQKDTLINAIGRFDLKQDNLKLEMHDSGFVNPLYFALEMQHPFKEPAIKIFEIHNLPASLFTGEFRNTRFFDVNKLSISSYLSGTPEYLRGKVKIFNTVTLDELLELNGKASHIFSDFGELEGDFSIHKADYPISGRYYMAAYVDKWHSFFYLDDYVTTQIKFDLSGSEPLMDAKMDVSNFPMFSYFTDSSSTSWDGYWNGNIDIGGPVSDLSGTFNLTLKDGIVNKVGYLDFFMNGQVDHNRIYIDSLQTFLNNRKIMEGKLSYLPATGTISGNMRGSNLELYSLSELFLNKRDFVKGQVNYLINLHGDSSGQLIECTAYSDQVSIKKETFRNVELMLVDSMKAGRFFSKNDHRIFVKNLNYNSDLGYSLKANGKLPLSFTDNFTIHLDAAGNILAHIPLIEQYFRKIDVSGSLIATVTGTLNQPTIESMDLRIADGTAVFREILKPVTNFKAHITKEKEDPFVHIANMEGFTDGQFASIYNLRNVILSDGRQLEPWYFDGFNLNFGILVLKSGEGGIPLNILGVMEPGEFGFYKPEGMNDQEEFYFSGPIDRPVVRGKLIGRNTRVTFPLLVSEEAVEKPGKVVEFLMGIEWDVLAKASNGAYYFVEIPAYVGKVYMDLNIDMTSPGLHFTGAISDESFRVSGEVFSYKGQVEYLETNFRVEKFGAVFTKYELFPEVYGRAYTTIRDSLNVPHEIYLQLYAIDPETKQEVQRGRWEDFRFKLVSNEPVVGDNQELVLAQMGYSVSNIPSKITEVGGQLTENLLIRPLVRPLERFLEKNLGLDYVRFRSAVAKNLMNYSLGNQFKWWNRENTVSFYNPFLSPNPTLMLLQSSEITFGKYLERNLYFSYTAQLMSLYESVNLHINQKLSLEYRLFRNLLFEVEYDYFKYMPYQYVDYDKQYDFIIRLRHSFNF
ncbi:MAG: hypothetical protein Kow00108_06190 [Calditrichia bacterium]